ncbi:hypothetical protein [Aminobacter sp. HY435]|uniref:hypothetical protein n=1 Tax=Aminobacter sp. HY435 TaxID=2970917 RepID=UPI0022B94419|nr:hypothetical protein [Aminobacter sp. HY435]
MRAANDNHPVCNDIRFRVDPRLVPLEKAARRLHLTRASFLEILPALVAHGFPEACLVTGHFDLKAIDYWLDQHAGLVADDRSQTQAEASRLVKARLASLT